MQVSENKHGVTQQPQRWYEMSQGEGTKMYTIWINYVNFKGGHERNYIQNLSINHDEAWVKAKEIAKGVELIDDSLESLIPITRGAAGLNGVDVIRIGKYKGQLVNELPDGYLLWVCGGGKIPDEESRRRGDEFACLFLIKEDQMLFAQKEAEKRGLYREFEGKLMPLGLIKWIGESRIGKGHHFTNGEKVKDIKATCIKTTGYDSMYGYTYVYVFKTEDSKQITYKGSRLYFKDKVVGHCGGGIDLPQIEKGTNCLLSGTIEHSNYRNEDITNIKRPKLMLTPEELKDFREREQVSIEEEKEWCRKEKERLAKQQEERQKEQQIA